MYEINSSEKGMIVASSTTSTRQRFLVQQVNQVWLMRSIIKAMHEFIEKTTIQICV